MKTKYKSIKLSVNDRKVLTNNGSVVPISVVDSDTSETLLMKAVNLLSSFEIKKIDINRIFRGDLPTINN